MRNKAKTVQKNGWTVFQKKDMILDIIGKPIYETAKQRFFYYQNGHHKS